ncbi:MAG: hypothetical protein Q9223_002307, partial [Gallowayella weberi]
MPLLIEEDSSNTPSSADELEDTNPSSNRKRKGTTPFNDRVLRAKVLPPAPEYEVTESPAIPGQQQGIEWLTANSKKLFDLVFANVVGRSGGVTPTHQGTCVLCFKDSGQDNSSAELRHLPSLQSSPLMYQYSDYSTTFTRAVGWFGLWRRTGVLLDNFQGHTNRCYKPMDATQLCHQEHCGMHITYELVEVKEDRKRCAAEARTARQEHKDIPTSCSRHSPPCLLQ